MPRENGVIDRPAWFEWGGIKFPVADGARLQRQPLNQFAPASSIGPPDRPSVDPRLAVVILSDMSGGRGVSDMGEMNGVNRFLRATLDTRFPQGLCMPPAVQTLAACPQAWDDTAPVEIQRVTLATGDRLVAYSPSTANAYLYNLASNTWGASIAFGLQDVVQWRNLVVGTRIGGAGIVTSSDGVTWPISTGAAWYGLCVFDNKVYSFNAGDGMLYATTDPTQGITTTGWQTASQPLYLNTGESVHRIIAFRDRGGYPALFVLTNQRWLGLNEDDGSWSDYHVFREDASPTHPRATVWKRDQMLYAANFGDTGDARLYVWQFTGSVNQAGPTKVQDGQGGGFDATEDFGRFILLRGNNHFLYGWGDNYGGCAGSGEVTAMNDQGGWHTVYRPADGDPVIRGGGLWGGDIYVMHADGTFRVVRDRDSMTSPLIRYPAGGGYTEVGPKRIYYGWTDCGLPNHWKIGSHFFADARLRDNSPGMPPGTLLAVKYRYDDRPWFALPAGEPLDSAQVLSLLTRTTTGGIKTWPLKIPLPFGTWDNQAGVAFRRMEIYAEMVANAAVDTPVLAELSLFYSRWTDPHWAYQITLDLTRDSFARKYREGTYEGRSLKDLRDALESMIRERRRWTIRYGSNEFAQTIPAADVLVAGREDPARGDGIYPITFRDLSVDRDV